MSFFTELKRRNVFRVAIAYLAAAWLLSEVATTLFPLFGFSDAPARIVVILLAIGFPLFLVFSWIFEITPEGLRLEKDVRRDAPITGQTQKKLDHAIIVLLILAVGYFAVDKFVLEPGRVADIVEETAQQARSEALVKSYGDHSIAVLPFVNMSGDPEQEYFSDGISEELLNLLAQIPELRVISRSSAFYYKGKDIKLIDIARELNVANVLEGSVRKAGDRVRITAQLIEARTDTHLWSKTYDRKFADIFTIQDEIAKHVVDEIEITLLGDYPHSDPADPEAYRLYLLGQYHLKKYDLPIAMQYLEQALALDPQYAQVHLAISGWYGAKTFFGEMPPREGFEKAKAELDLALEINSNVPGAYRKMGSLNLYYYWDWLSAEKALKQAIASVPSDASVYQTYAWFLSAMGRLEEAQNTIMHALELEPLAPGMHTTASNVFYLSRQHDLAIAQCQEALKLNPNFHLAFSQMGWSYVQLGRFDEAINNMEQSAKLFPGDIQNLWMLGHAYAVAGKTVQAREILAEMHNLAEKRYVMPYGFAMIHIGLGEKQQAMDWLEKAFEDRNGWMPFLRVEPRFDPLRTEPRFKDLIDRMNFPD